MVLRENNYTRGFTLIETLVAVLILMLAITGPLSLYSKFITQSDEIQRTATANYLAEEGYFLLFQKLYEANNNESQISPSCAEGSGGCSINYDGSIGGGSCNPYTNCGLYKDTQGRYTSISTGGNTLTPFYRTVSYRIVSTENPALYCNSGDTFTSPGRSEIQIISRVQWLEESGLRVVTLSRSSFDPLILDSRCVPP